MLLLHASSWHSQKILTLSSSFLEYGGIDLLIWGLAWSHDSVTALHISLTNIHHRYRQNVLVIILAMRYLGTCHHPFWPWKSSWDSCWPGNCIHHLDADGKQTLWVAHVVYISSWYCQDDVPVASSAQGASTDRWSSTRQRCQLSLIQHSGEKRQPI